MERDPEFDKQLAKFAGYVAGGVAVVAIGAAAVYVAKKTSPRTLRTLRHLANRTARELRRASRDQVDDDQVDDQVDDDGRDETIRDVEFRIVK